MDRVDYQPLIIQDVLNLQKRDELNLRPWYQRRAVWTQQQQAYLINTLHEQKPVPSIYIRHQIDMVTGKSVREVVDGQQRLTAVIDYSQDKFPARHPHYDKPMKFGALKTKERHQFLTTSLAVGYLLGASDPDVIEIFGRINSVSKTLNPQEKRNASFSGEFKQFCLRQASLRVDFWRTANIFTATNIARMVEIQFVAELAMNMMEGLQDYSPQRIDAFYTKYDEVFPEEASVTKRFDATFSTFVSVPNEDIKDTIFHRSPIFFSLFLILDDLKNKVSSATLGSAIAEIDARFEQRKKSAEDAQFQAACTSNPHRIVSREVRDRYIRGFLK